MKIISALLLLVQVAFADFVTDFEQGAYTTDKNIYYALGESQTSQKDYRQYAFLDAKRSLATQLISSISSHQNFNRSSKRVNGIENTTSSYTESASLDVSNLPILGTTTLNRELKGNTFYILVKFDLKEVSKLYSKEAERLVKQIDENYRFYKEARQITLKEKHLNTLKTLYENYDTYALMCSLMQVSHRKPSVTVAQIDKHLFNLYNEQATEIADLAKIVISRLSLKKVNKPIEILPIGYEEKFRTTKFSHRLKHLLQNELYNKVEVTKAVFTPFKLIGTYTLEDDRLQLHVMIVDKEAKVIDSAVAQMKVQDRSLFLEHSQQEANPNEPYAIMENYFENW